MVISHVLMVMSHVLMEISHVLMLIISHVFVCLHMLMRFHYKLEWENYPKMGHIQAKSRPSPPPNRQKPNQAKSGPKPMP